LRPVFCFIAIQNAILEAAKPALPLAGLFPNVAMIRSIPDPK
jgi:hypothetical protein